MAPELTGLRRLLVRISDPNICTFGSVKCVETIFKQIVCGNMALLGNRAFKIFD